MRLSVTFSGFGGLADTMPIVQAAEEHGLDGVWTAEHRASTMPSFPAPSTSPRRSASRSGLSG